MGPEKSRRNRVSMVANELAARGVGVLKVPTARSVEAYAKLKLKAYKYQEMKEHRQKKKVIVELLGQMFNRKVANNQAQPQLQRQCISVPYQRK